MSTWTTKLIQWRLQWCGFNPTKAKAERFIRAIQDGTWLS